MYAGFVVIATISFGVLINIQHSIRADLPVDEETDLGRYVAFTDVPPEHPAHEAIYALTKQGVVHGYPDKTFAPDKVSNRAETIKTLLQISPMESNDIHELYHRYVEKEIDMQFFIFPDIDKDSWFAPYILKAVRLGLVKGNPTGNFEAGRPVTLAEFLKMLFVLEREQIANDDEILQPFEKVDAFMWYTPYFVRAKNIDLLPVRGEEVNPSEELTRGRIAEIIYRYFQLRTQVGR